MARFIPYLHKALRNNCTRFRGRLLACYFRMHGCKVGKGLRAGGWPVFRSVPDGNIQIGDHVSLGTNIALQPIGTGIIILDDHVKLIHDVYILAANRVHIGKHSGVAERCSIRDAEHGAARGTPMYEQDIVALPIHIGSDVQVSLGCAILPGTSIADGVIVGAGCIMTRNVQTVENGIYFGNPPRLIGKRA